MISAFSNYKFPYAKGFHEYLKYKDLKDDSINDYSETIDDFFNYLDHFNESYIRDKDISNIITNDVDDYLTMVYTERNCTDATYNKLHTHLSIYFRFLFERGINGNLPTYFIKRKKLNYKNIIDFTWIENLDEIIDNPAIHMYTKMFLILISQGYAPKEILRPGFYKKYSVTDFTKYQSFKSDFDSFISEYQTLQGSKDIFLKKRYSIEPNLTHRGLRKYLYPDSKILQMELIPSKLFQSFNVYFISKHSNVSVNELSKRLNIKISSVMYYLNLINKTN